RDILAAARLQRLDLVLHQGDEWRHDDREVIADERRELVAKGLARAGRHHDERVAPGERGLARLALPGTEAREAEELVERVLEVHAARLSPRGADPAVWKRPCYVTSEVFARRHCEGSGSGVRICSSC